ncbi:hypothetical protein PFZ59_05100 [Streptococcus suis]|uniref:hypothetical protein n=1 Tax=Streptococcus suis TaxID=1307 RepID=UPI00240E632F|nr:hypothetical protein [Streptococcus suis]WFA76808.1 hypothetical protein PFZ59_05100 [Streptococcus suis]
MPTVSSFASTNVVISEAITVSSARTCSAVSPPPTTAPAATKPRNNFVADSCRFTEVNFTFELSDALCFPK